MPKPEYQYTTSTATHDDEFLINPVLELLKRLELTDKTIFELVCGNGKNANVIQQQGFEVTAVDSSKSGIEQAKIAYPNCNFGVASAYDDLAQSFGTFDCVISLEVVEHLTDPRSFSRNIFNLLRPGGTAIISTPYHGYTKNLALALMNKFDSHLDPLWDGGHIKFWSKNTLEKLLSETGFAPVSFELVGRISILAKSMIAVTQKPRS